MRFDPFREFDRLTGEMPSARRSPMMAMDAYRHGDAVTVKFDLPGVDRDSIDITVEKNQLSVSAERAWRPAESDEVVASERTHGQFTRTLFLGDGLDADQIDADYADGVLSLTIPVAETAKPRKISVGNAQPALSS
jgi:HSP20 family protein